MSFNKKVVLVTGGSSGIGAAIAIKFAAEGAKVAIVGRNEKKLKNVYEKIKKVGSKPLVIVADVTKDNDIVRIMKDTLKHFKKLDVLVNNAGIGGLASIMAEEALQVFDQVIRTNLRSVVYLTHLASKHLVATKGNIINISSVAGIGFYIANDFSYGTSKAGLDHFTRTVAAELASKGVRVNSINPGPVKTDNLENTGAPAEHIAAIFEYIKSATALNRLSEAEEIADIALFLASNKAAALTGASFVTDNGTLVKSIL